MVQAMTSFAKNRCLFLTTLIVLALLFVVQCASAELGNNVYGYNESDTLNWVGYEPITLDKYYPRYEAFDGRSHWDNWYANVFTAGSDENNTGSDVEVITAVSFYAKTQADHDIYIYLNPESGNPATGEPISHTYVNKTKIKTNELNYVNLSTLVPVCNGNTFSVVIKVHAENSRSIPIEWTWYEGEQIKYPSCNRGQSYIGCQGYDGLSWVDMKDTSTEYSNSNVWIKAYTEERAKGDEVQGVIFVPSGPDGYWAGSIEAAVSSASEGDIIVVNPGVYSENLVINKENLSILSLSGSPDDTIVKSYYNNLDVFKVTSNNVTIRGFSIEGARYYDPLSGIHLDNVENCLIANNALSNNWEGLYLKNSNRNTLINNIANSNSGYGFYLLNSQNNTFAQSKANSNDDGGFYLRNSEKNIFINNNASTSEGYGFHLSDSRNNFIVSNNISENGYGIRMEDSSNGNEVSENKVLQNRAYGISPYYSSNNLIFDNYFYNKNNTFFEDDISQNYWNTTKRIKRWNIVYGDYEGGNYWSQPDGKGLSQNYNDTNGDGICDDSTGSTLMGKLTTNLSSKRIDYLPLADPNIRLVGLGNTYPYNRIQDALDHSKDNFTIIIYPGDYSDSVYVYREVKIKSNSIDPRKVNVSYSQSEDLESKSSVFYVISNNVSINGLTVENGGSGIWLDEVQSCIINNSYFLGNTAGIYLNNSQNNNLTNNVADSNYAHGVWLFNSCYNSLKNNVANKNQNSGFYVSFSSNNNNLSGNIADSNELRGIWISNSSDSNTLIQNNASDNEYGIYLEYSDNNNLSHNNASANGFGIYLWTSVENVVTGNLISKNNGTPSQGYGVYLAIDSKNNTVWVNNISGNRYGARLGSHADNNHFFANYFDNLASNTLFETTHINCWNSSDPQIYVYKNNTYLNYLGNCYADYNGNDDNSDGMGDTPYWENGDKYPVIQENWPVDLKVEKPVKNLDTGEWFDTIQEAVNNANDYDTIAIYRGTYTENVVVNKPVTIKSASGNSKDTIVQAKSQYDHVFNISSDNVIITGLTLKGAYGHDPCSGIYLKAVKNCTIKDNVLLNNWYGIYAVSSEDITIKDNEAEDSRDYGIKLFDSSNQKILNNKVNLNYYGGIYLFNSGSNSLIDNNASSNLWYGVQLNSSSDNTLENNTANSNENSGIYLKSSSENKVRNNTLEFNSISGIFLNSSSSNLIFNNYFYNSQNARFAGSNLNNLWNTTKTESTEFRKVKNIVKGPTLGGNYWASPGGNGFSQTHEDRNGDGICDEAYTLETEEDNGAEGENIDQLPLYFPRTLRVNCNGSMEFETIQEAVDYAEKETINDSENDGFIIVIYPGTYNESVNVRKKLTIRSYSGNPEDTYVKANSSETYVFNVSSDNVNIEGFSIIGKNKYAPYSGVFLGKVKNCNIENNYLSESYYGIYLDSCQNLTLQNNTASSNSGPGIFLNDSKNNSLFNNTANSNSVSGIYLKNSDNNSLCKNTADSNSVHGIWLSSASNNNTLCNNIAKENMEYGIVLEYSCNYNNLSCNNASSNYEYGFCLKHNSCNNTLFKNSANSNKKSGFWLYNRSSNNELLGNTADANSEYGIYLYNSSNSNSILQNNVSSNGVYGIYLRTSDSNELGFSNNNQNNSQLANNSQITGGNRVENNNCGICLDNSHKNLISNNYFNNIQNTCFEGPNTENRWNITKTEDTNIFGGPYLGGNFWAKPDGTGLSQVNRDLTGDGILDKKLDNSKRVVGLEYQLSPDSSQEIINPEELNVDYLPLAQTITVDCEGNKSKYTSIETALKNAENGYSLAIYPGNYSENLQIDKNLAIIAMSEQTEGAIQNETKNIIENTAQNETKNTTENTRIKAKNSRKDVFNISSNGVILSGFSITGANGTESASGIHLKNAKNCTLGNNLVSNNSIGIWLEFSGGISGENTLSNNSMFSNKYNFKDSGTLTNNIDKSNIVGNNREEEKPIYYLCNLCNLCNSSSNLEINSSTNAGVVYCINCKNIIIKDLALENNSNGISFYNTTNSLILNNTVFNNFNGIALNSSLGNTLKSNRANANENSGIYFSDSDSNTLKNNIAQENTEFGFLLQASDHNTLENNTAQENSRSGFSILASENNNILENKLTSNSNAIFLDDSRYTELSSNIADSNTYGFYLNSSENNTLTDNELISNSDSGIYLNSFSEFNKLENNTLSGSQFGLQVRNSRKNTFLKNQVSENEYGILLKNSNFNNLSSNRIVSNSLYGISLEASGQNLIFNNYFKNSNNTDPVSENSENFWNTTKTPGINIVEGPWLGGNFWATPAGTGFSQTCEDIDEDYICTKYSISNNSIDYFPLSEVPASLKVAPQVEFLNADYTSGLSPHSVNFTAASSSNVRPVKWSWDFGDGSFGDSFSQNETLSGNKFSDSGSVNHTYTLSEGLSSKTYNITLTARNVYGSASKTCEVLVLEPIASSLSINNNLVNLNDSTKEIIINSTLLGENVQILENKTLLVQNPGIELYIYSTGLEKTQSGNWKGKYTYAKLEKTAESELWGNFSSRFSFNASLYGNLSTLLNPDAKIYCGIVPGLPGNSIETAFNNSLSSSNLELENTTYSLIIKKSGLEGIEVKDANIFMTAPCDFINESGGPETYAIMSWNEDEKRAEKLTTDYSMNGTSFEFIGISPEGFSIKSLLSFSSKPSEGTGSSSGGGSSGGGGSGGGSGGTSSPEDQDNIELKELASAYFISGTHVKFDFPVGVTCVNYLEFDAKRSFGKVSASVEMLKGQSSLVSSLPEGVIYKNLNIWVGSKGVSNSSNMENAIVGFKVNKTWVETENINVSTITLHRYSNDSWNALPTYSAGENGTYLLFEAETPAFSPFVITGFKEPEVVQTQVAQTPVTEETEAIPSVSEGNLENNSGLKATLKKLLSYGALAAVIVLLSALLIRKKISSKKEQEPSDYDLDNLGDIGNVDLEETGACEVGIDEVVIPEDDSDKTDLSESLDLWDENENESVSLSKQQNSDEEESTKTGTVLETGVENSEEDETVRTDVEKNSGKSEKEEPEGEKEEAENKGIEEEDFGEQENLKTDVKEDSGKEEKDETENKELEEELSVKEESFKKFLSQLRKSKDSEPETSVQEKEVTETSEASGTDEELKVKGGYSSENASENEEEGEDENSFKAFLSQLKKRNLSEDKKSGGDN